MGRLYPRLLAGPSWAEMGRLYPGF